MKSKAVAALLRGATRGDVEAMIRLSAMHLYGQGVDRDPAEALRWAREAAEAGSLEGAYMAATLLLADRDGVRGGEHLAQAEDLIRKAAEGGYEPAVKALQQLAPAGKTAGSAKAASAEADGSSAAAASQAGRQDARLEQVYRKLEADAAAGDAKAMYIVGWSLVTGDTFPGLAKDPARGARLLEQAAEQGHAQAQIALAELMLSGKQLERDAARGAFWLGKAAQSSDEEVLAMACSFYMQGREGLPADEGKACACLRRAADLGSPKALYQLALMLAEGRGTAKDPVKAVRCARKAAGRGIVLAQHFLGDCYWKGEGVAASVKAAFFWYEKAAKAGVSASRRKLALMLAEGQGCRKNEARARAMLEELTAGGDAQAEVLLARLLCRAGGEDAARGMDMLRARAEAG
ncbi:MAG: sel1 repeat family protein, partial [Desulfovibrio sp.]|nr:sel1 repeat family protein [Desulfovibrio sp.]